MIGIACLLRRVRAWMAEHKLRTVLLVALIAFSAPWPARAQFIDPCCAILAAGLTSIQSALTNIIGGGLNQVLSVDQSIQHYEQSVVWPQNLIAQAQNLVGALQGNFRQIQNLSRIPVSSATLPSAQQLEQLLLSRNPARIAQTSAVYTALYGPVPAVTAASQPVLNMYGGYDRCCGAGGHEARY